MTVRALPASVSLFVRSSAVGLVATGVDVALLTLLLAREVPLVVASPIALVAGAACQFAGNRTVTFPRARGPWVRQAALFALVEVVVVALNTALTALASAALHLPPPVVRVPVTSAVYFGVSLPLWSRIFRERSADR